MVHDMMQMVFKSDRRMSALSELEVTLSAADKEALKAAALAKAAETGVDPAQIDMNFPDKMKLSL